MLCGLQDANLLPPSGLQSAHRSHHSTETPLMKVLCDILEEADMSKVTRLGLRDSSAAFNTVDQSILVQPLRTSHSGWTTSRYGGSLCAWLGELKLWYSRAAMSAHIYILFYFVLPRSLSSGHFSLFPLYTVDATTIMRLPRSTICPYRAVLPTNPCLLLNFCTASTTLIIGYLQIALNWTLIRRSSYGLARYNLYRRSDRFNWVTDGWRGWYRSTGLCSWSDYDARFTTVNEAACRLHRQLRQLRSVRRSPRAEDLLLRAPTRWRRLCEHLLNGSRQMDLLIIDWVNTKMRCTR